MSCRHVQAIFLATADEAGTAVPLVDAASVVGSCGTLVTPDAIAWACDHVISNLGGLTYCVNAVSIAARLLGARAASLGGRPACEGAKVIVICDGREYHGRRGGGFISMEQQRDGMAAALRSHAPAATSVSFLALGEEAGVETMGFLANAFSGVLAYVHATDDLGAGLEAVMRYATLPAAPLTVSTGGRVVLRVDAAAGALRKICALGGAADAGEGGRYDVARTHAAAGDISRVTVEAATASTEEIAALTAMRLAAEATRTMAELLQSASTGRGSSATFSATFRRLLNDAVQVIAEIEDTIASAGKSAPEAAVSAGIVTSPLQAVRDALNVAINHGEEAVTAPIWRALYATLWRLANTPLITGMRTSPALAASLEALRLDRAMLAAKQEFIADMARWVEDPAAPDEREDRYSCLISLESGLMCIPVRTVVHKRQDVAYLAYAMLWRRSNLGIGVRLQADTTGLVSLSAFQDLLNGGGAVATGSIRVGDAGAAGGDDVAAAGAVGGAGGAATVSVDGKVLRSDRMASRARDLARDGVRVAWMTATSALPLVLRASDVRNPWFVKTLREALATVQHGSAALSRDDGLFVQVYATFIGDMISRGISHGGDGGLARGSVANLIDAFRSLCHTRVLEARAGAGRADMVAQFAARPAMSCRHNVANILAFGVVCASEGLSPRVGRVLWFEFVRRAASRIRETSALAITADDDAGAPIWRADPEAVAESLGDAARAADRFVAALDILSDIRKALVDGEAPASADIVDAIAAVLCRGERSSGHDDINTADGVAITEEKKDDAEADTRVAAGDSVAEVFTGAERSVRLALACARSHEPSYRTRVTYATDEPGGALYSHAATWVANGTELKERVRVELLATADLFEVSPLLRVGNSLRPQLTPVRMQLRGQLADRLRTADTMHLAVLARLFADPAAVTADQRGRIIAAFDHILEENPDYFFAAGGKARLSSLAPPTGSVDTAAAVAAVLGSSRAAGEAAADEEKDADFTATTTDLREAVMRLPKFRKAAEERAAARAAALAERSARSRREAGSAMAVAGAIDDAFRQWADTRLPGHKLNVLPSRSKAKLERKMVAVLTNMIAKEFRASMDAALVSTLHASSTTQLVPY